MAKVAVISDIHGNLEALTSVFDDIDQQGIKTVLCLGDIVGYGPDPIACTDIVRNRCSIVVCGNHDEAVFKGPWGFNHMAGEAIEWTVKQLKPRFFRMGSRARWNFLSELPLCEKWGDYLLAHGSPRSPTSEYVLPYHVAWPPPGMFEEIFAKFPTVCFVGHTHFPGIFMEGPRFVPQNEAVEPFTYEGQKLLINVGSVGQPRDRNQKASYLTFEEGEFEFRRVAYPFEITQEKIRSTVGLDNRLADRLELGE